MHRQKHSCLPFDTPTASAVVRRRLSERSADPVQHRPVGEGLDGHPNRSDLSHEPEKQAQRAKGAARGPFRLAPPLAEDRSFKPRAAPPPVLAYPVDLVPAAAARRGLVDSLAAVLTLGRLQLVCGIVFAILLPTSVRAGVNWLGHAAPVDQTSLITLAGATVALILGFLALRQIRAFPGVGSPVYVLWVFSAAYVTLLVILLFGRIEYSRYQLAACFCLTVLWFLAIHYLVIRRKPMRLLVVPSRRTSVLPQADHVVWAPLRQPVAQMTAEGVVADLTASHPPEWEAFLTRCALDGLPIFDVKQVGELLTGRVDIEHLSENKLAYKVHTTTYRKIKRLIDSLLVLVIAPFILPVVIVAGMLVRLESPGSALFRQTRMGYRGKVFTVLKLRTMYQRAKAGESFTTTDDPRVTPLGRLLRKYHIDELPQAWNILMGDMSWIGPRPEAVDLSQWYEREVPFYGYRHIVRPGISGWAQVHQGNVAAAVDIAKLKLQYDFFYIKNLSPWLDMVVVVKTLRAIVTGFGSH